MIEDNYEEKEERLICPKCGKAEDTQHSWIKRDGHCLWCDCKIGKEQRLNQESEDAVKEGEGNSEEDAICPYCGEFQSDSWEYSDETEIQCCKCDKNFGMTKEYSVNYKTYKLEK